MLKTDNEQFTLTTKKSLHINFKVFLSFCCVGDCNDVRGPMYSTQSNTPFPGPRVGPEAVSKWLNVQVSDKFMKR